MILITEGLVYSGSPFPILWDVFAGIFVKLQPILDSLFLYPILKKVVSRVHTMDRQGPAAHQNDDERVMVRVSALTSPCK